jgi:hypothetical protein
MGEYMNTQEWFAQAPYEQTIEDKHAWMLPLLNQRMVAHYDACEPFRHLLDAMANVQLPISAIEQLPYLPVQLFKMQKWASVPDAQIIKVLTSSGTSGQQPSRIYLDKETALLQTKALVQIVKSFIGGARLPMIIVDSQMTLSNRSSFSARGAGILGFSNFGRDHFYLLDSDMNVDWQGLEAFCQRHSGGPMLMFGFTSIIWQYFYEVAVAQGRNLADQLAQAVLIHGGGWKKLADRQIGNERFKQALGEQLGITKVYNYYGMVEQVGSIYMECEAGHLHAPHYADILVRDPFSLAVVPHGVEGLIQTISLLPQSYPGNSLLTEDLGVIDGVDDCVCGRKGTHFRVNGRLPAAELRGCSDTFTAAGGVR